MRQIINVLLRLPKWYGLTIILIYSVGIHFQDDTSRPHVRGAADELTGVL